MTEKSVLMAVIGAPHGIKGEVRIKSFTGDPLALADYSPLRDAKGKAYAISAVRPQGDVIVARIKGVDDRNAAETLNGVELFVDRAQLPPEEEGEFYHDDLVGLSVRDEAGKTIGVVTAVQNYGGGDVLELNLEGRKGALIPFTHAAVPEVHVGDGYISIDTLAAGLVDDEDEDGEPDHGVDDGGFDPKQRDRGPKDAGGNR
ncbi:16S rRNA processing protein RimM [Salmonella enterica subsp. enterica serovar Virchow]|nr:16S rRNA processing protein RimM [Salmonella enterica subsp. enterica serovar Virchow]